VSDTTRKFPSLRDLVKSVMRPDLLAIRTFYNEETKWMRDILDEQTKVILELQGILTGYNALTVDMVSRLNTMQQSINMLIEDRASTEQVTILQTSISQRLDEILGQLKGVQQSEQENTVALNAIKVKLGMIN